MKRTAALILVLAAGCLGPEPVPELPFDARPAMGSMREDAAEIARILGAGRSLDAVTPARRLAEIQLGPGLEPPPEFRELEEGFRAAAAALSESLDRGEQRENGVRYRVMLERCDACHERFRPGGMAGE
ncbi:MAG: hypothetical protein V2A76_17865 [Planctomycetota bacterium]